MEAGRESCPSCPSALSGGRYPRVSPPQETAARDGVPRGSCSSHHPGHCGHLHDLSPRPANLCGHKGRQVCRRGTRHPSVGSARGDGGIRSLQGPTGFPWFLPSSLEVATSSGHFVPTLGVKVELIQSSINLSLSLFLSPSSQFPRGGKNPESFSICVIDHISVSPPNSCPRHLECEGAWRCPFGRELGREGGGLMMGLVPLEEEA